MDRDILINNALNKCAKAQEQNYIGNLHFLNLQEQSWMQSISKQLNTRMLLFGGYDDAERKMPIFIPEGALEDFSSIVGILKIQPVSPKFSETLTHRDYLGALIHLGIKRELLGDIIENNGTAYLFVMMKILPFICENLNKIKHTEVIITQCSLDENIDLTKKFESRMITVASMRLDAIVAQGFRISRTIAVKYIESEKVFINHQMTSSLSDMIKVTDIISLRGVGKFKVNSIKGESKKGRIMIEILMYT